MARVEEILDRVRVILGDSGKTRWSDSSLISRLNEGQNDIARKTEIFKSVAVISLTQGQYLYTLPTNTIRAYEVLFAQEPVEIIQSSEMAKRYGADWRLHTTDSADGILAIVTDREDTRKIRVYPRPFIAGLYDSYVFSPDTFGIVSAMTEYTIDSAFGLSGSVYDIELIDDEIDLFGIIVDAVEGDYITAEYVRIPNKVTAITEDPELPEAFDTALVKYIAGTALRDDTTSANRSAGNEELVLYMGILDDILGTSVTGGTTISKNSSVSYNGMG